MLQRKQLMRGKEHYRIYSNKRRGAQFLQRQVRRLFECGAYLNTVPDKFTFSIFLFNSHLLSLNFRLD